MQIFIEQFCTSFGSVIIVEQETLPTSNAINNPKYFIFFIISPHSLTITDKYLSNSQIYKSL